MKVSFSLFLFFFFISLCLTAQLKDSGIALPADSVLKVKTSKNAYADLLGSNIFLNTNGNPQALLHNVKKRQSSNVFFYILASFFLFLGLLRTIFSRYFTTMFRVFFNTSLRQNQLTDQLEQAALPSLLYNIFFMLSMGLYLYFVYKHYNPEHQKNNWYYVGLFTLLVGICYMAKYVSLRFMGWLTNHKPEAKIYIFSVFLLNKIIGMLLLPFTMLIAFSSYKIASYASVISIFILAVLFISRFFRSYGLLQNRLKLNGIHFLIYIISLEILPIMVIYKSMMLFFRNSS